MATLYGLSPRMRFDLVVNILTAKAYHEGVIPIHGGSQFRPNLHVRDAARAYVAMLEAPFEAVAGEVYNVGTEEQNHAIMDIGEIVQTALPEADLQVDASSDDPRSYQVDFRKIHDQTHFETRETIAGGVTEIAEALQDGRFTDFTGTRYSNYRTTLASLDD
jgi:nucleoside-diphosphate-sugar epimerase